MAKKTYVYGVAGIIASIRGKKPHVYRVIILKQMADLHLAMTRGVIFLFTVCTAHDYATYAEDFQ